MNERIREIAEQAAYDTRKEHNNAYWRMQDEMSEDATWREKFAELIIQQCISKQMELIANYEAPTLGYEPVFCEFRDGHIHGLKESVDMIHQHFGIK